MVNVILFGYGNMGSSLSKGWGDMKDKFNFYIIEKNNVLKAKAIENNFLCFSHIDDCNFKGITLDIIVLAVKPQQMEETVKQIKTKLNRETLFISIAAGLSFDWFCLNLDNQIKIIRAMPNTPAAVGRGITGMWRSDNVSKNEFEYAQQLLKSIGKTLTVSSEDMINVVTAISGSGPAYIFYFVEVLSELGQTLGLETKNAELLAVETLVGSAKLLDLSDENSSILRKKVTSPGGTTEAAMEILMKKNNGLKYLLTNTLKHAIKKAEQLDLNN